MKKCVAVLLLTMPFGLAQTADPPAFDVALIKPAQPGGGSVRVVPRVDPAGIIPYGRGSDGSRVWHGLRYSRARGDRRPLPAGSGFATLGRRAAAGMRSASEIVWPTTAFAAR